MPNDKLRSCNHNDKPLIPPSEGNRSLSTVKRFVFGSRLDDCQQLCNKNYY